MNVRAPLSFATHRIDEIVAAYEAAPAGRKSQVLSLLEHLGQRLSETPAPAPATSTDAFVRRPASPVRASRPQGPRPSAPSEASETPKEASQASSAEVSAAGATTRGPNLRRRHKRINTIVPAFVRIGTTSGFPAQILDFSEGGLFIMPQSCWRDGALVDAKQVLAGLQCDETVSIETDRLWWRPLRIRWIGRSEQHSAYGFGGEFVSSEASKQR
jgi:hypothetical protein